MLKIRLQRVGRIHDPSFRLIVTEHTRSAKKGNGVEVLGSYDARTDRKDINEERVKYWLSKGAKPSDTAYNILIDKGLVKGDKIKGVAKKVEAPKEEQVKAEAPAGDVPAPEVKDEEVSEPVAEAPADEIVAPQAVAPDAPVETKPEEIVS